MSFGFHPRMIFVRPWNGIPTMVHAFAIIRDIERRFGRVQEFVVVRDPDVPSDYSPFLHATFTREEDAASIPPDGKVIQIAAPQVDRKRDGGIGLDDLHVYLNPETREQALLDKKSTAANEPNWGPPEGDVIDVKLERTSLRQPPAVLDQPFGFNRRGPPHLNNPMRTRELAYAIHSFGGFVDRFRDPTRKQSPMEAVVLRWSRLVKQPPQPQLELAPENKVERTLAEKSEKPITSEEEIPWTSFETSSVAPSLFPTPLTPSVAPIPSSPPLAPSSPVPQSNPPLETNTEPIPKPKPNSEPVPKAAPAEPKISRKRRMLNAARVAGAMAAVKPLDASEELVGTHTQTASPPVFDAGTEQANSELCHVPRASEEENKVSARRWWKFLMSGN